MLLPALFISAVAILIASVDQVAAGVIKFDEFAAQNANGTIPANQYANWGVTFDGTDDGSTWAGLGGGDPGGWGVEGTNGTIISAHNGTSYSNRMVFDDTVRSFAIDVTRANGSSPSDSFTLEGWKNGVMVESRVIALDDVDAWRTVALFSSVDEVRWSGNGGAFHPFAVDNARWTNEQTSRILFDEYAAQNANGAGAGDYSPLGATVTGSDDGSTWEGTELGDPGGWGVNGTEGSVFAAHNGASYSSTVTFDTDVKNVAVDISRAGGSSTDDTVTVEGWKNGALVESKTVDLDAVDTWTTVTLLSTVDEVRLSGNGAAFHPFAADNLRWTRPDAGVILFDEFAADNTGGGIAADRYVAQGVSLIATDDGTTWDGVGRGDPGGWGVEGTNGSVFAGFNGGSYGLDMMFDGIIEALTMDVARAAGSSEGDLFTIEGYLNGLLVDAMTAELTAIDTWMPFALSGQIDQVHLFGSGAGFHPFAIDNINWLWVERNAVEPVPVPAPAALPLFVAGLLALVLAGRGLSRVRLGIAFSGRHV